MSASNSNSQKEIECVLISDEDDDDIPESKLANKPAAFNTNDTKPPIIGHFLLDDSDGRRVSRRRKNKNEHSDDGKNIDQSRNAAGRSNGNDHSNDAYKNSPNSHTSNASGDRKYGVSSGGGGGGGGSGAENRAETRSRKRERTPSPVPIDAREIQYKEILSGLEGAAFQSRFVNSE